VIDYGLADRNGRRITLRDVNSDNWRDVADVAPHDDQRQFVPALAARYLLLSTLEPGWNSLAIYADENVVGHAMWAMDDDGAHWIGGALIDATHQRAGIGRAAMQTLIRWLADQPDCYVIRLSYHPDNTTAARFYESLVFRPTGDREGEEIVAGRRP
jgi:diamine N-acetyltransferase